MPLLIEEDDHGFGFQSQSFVGEGQPMLLVSGATGSSTNISSRPQAIRYESNDTNLKETLSDSRPKDPLDEKLVVIEIR